jgi:hypothetical protein
MRLIIDDLRRVLERLPRDIRSLMKENRGTVLAGGFIRDVIAGDRASDIDLFSPSEEYAIQVAGQLKERWKARLTTTKNAITLIAMGRIVVQFITRWTYEWPTEVVASFDFTIAGAAVFMTEGGWDSVCHEHFYTDLAARRLRYTHPQRSEDAGGSMMRVVKFLRRGYSISPEDLGGVMARLWSGVDLNSWVAEKGEEGRAQLVTALLREVDPLLVIDGLEVAEELDGERIKGAE